MFRLAFVSRSAVLARYPNAQSWVEIAAPCVRRSSPAEAKCGLVWNRETAGSALSGNTRRRRRLTQPQSILTKQALPRQHAQFSRDRAPAARILGH